MPPGKKRKADAAGDERAPKRGRRIAGHKSDRVMTAEQWHRSGMSTYATVIFQEATGELIELGGTKSISTTPNRPGHAEDVALRVIEENLEMFAPSTSGTNHLILSVSKSPCTSEERPHPKEPGRRLPKTSGKAVGCTERLIELARKGLTKNGETYRFDLTVLCRGLYGPGGRDVLAASQAAVNEMRRNGITVRGDDRGQAEEASEERRRREGRFGVEDEKKHEV